MIILPIIKTPEQEQLELLLPRLHPQNQNYQKLHYYHKRLTNTYLGSKVLNEILYPKEFYQKFIFYNLRLPTNDFFFKINLLITTPYVIYLIVVVHVGNEISFSESDKITYTQSDGKKTTAPNPLFEVNSQILHLQQFLKQHEFPHIPIHPIITFTHPRVMLGLDKHSLDMIHSRFLLEHISNLRSTYHARFYQIEELQRLTTQIKKHHSSDKTNIIKKYQIPDLHIRPGVWCPSCKKAMMNREHGYWKCPFCTKRSNDAHVEALREYAVLYDTHITNKAARKFLRVNSATIVYRLFTNLNVDHSGKTQAFSYHLDTLIH